MIFSDEEPQVLPSVITLKHLLSDIIEPDFGLVDELLRLQVLSHKQCDKVRRERTVYKRNDTLLELLTSEDQCVQFLEALRRTEQQHVANFITQNGGQKRT